MIFVDFCLYFTVSIYRLTAKFLWIFAFFSLRMKAIDIILVDLESPERGLHFWFFLFLDHFLLW